MAPLPKKQHPDQSKSTPGSPKKAPGVNVFQELASHLSQLTGKLDKEGNVIRASAPVMVAAGNDGKPIIRLPGVISTRCETMDAAIGVGGLPMSRLTVITGGEGGGKTTIAGHACAEAQAMGGAALYVDNEHKLDLDYMASLGVDNNKLLLTQPSTVEDSFNIMNEGIKWYTNKYPDLPMLAVLDSLNATKSEKEYEEDGSADFSEANQGGLGAMARFMSTNLPKLVRAISGKKVAVLFISQPRDNIGTPGRNMVAGGNATKFYAALIIELYRKGFWEESARKIGSHMIAKMIKNQVSAPFKEAEVFIRWGLGVDYNKSLMDQAVQAALISSSTGGWYEMPTEVEGKPMKWQGMKGWHKLTKERPELAEQLKALVRAKYGQRFEEPTK